MGLCYFAPWKPGWRALLLNPISPRPRRLGRSHARSRPSLGWRTSRERHSDPDSRRSFAVVLASDGQAVQARQSDVIHSRKLVGAISVRKHSYRTQDGPDNEQSQTG
jgi:hypothetical protein